MQTVVKEGAVKEYAPIIAPKAAMSTMYSSLKVSKETGDIVTRWYSVSDQEENLTLEADMPMYMSNLLEENHGAVDHTVEVKPYQIITLGFGK